MHRQMVFPDHIAAKNRRMVTPADTAVVISDWRGVKLVKATRECRLKSCWSMEKLRKTVRPITDKK